MRPLHCDLHFERAGARGGETIRNGSRSGLHEMHGLRQRLPERRFVFRFRETIHPGSQIGRNQEDLLRHMAGRNRGRTGISGKFPRCAGCLRDGPVPDGARLRHGHHVSHSKNVEIVPGKRIVLLPVQFEVFREDSKSRLGICSVRLRLDWLERAQRLGPLP